MPVSRVAPAAPQPRPHAARAAAHVEDGPDRPRQRVDDVVARVRVVAVARARGARLAAAAWHTAAMPRSVLIVTEDRVGEMLGGAAIRALRDRALAHRRGRRDARRARHRAARPSAGAARAVRAGDPRPLRGLFRDADVVIMRPPNPVVAGWLRASKARDRLRPLRSAAARHPRGAGVVLARAAAVLAHDRARPLPRGAAHRPPLHLQREAPARPLPGRAARLAPHPARRLRAPTRRSAPSSTRVPFGIPSEPPRRVAGAGPRARFPAIGEDAQIVLWNGGIWNWLDPCTAVAATVKAAERCPRVRLVFMFARGASTAQSGARRAPPATLAERLGALDRLVFFNEDRDPVRGARDLAAGCRLHHLDPPRPPRGQLLLPHAAARLLLGGRAGGLHRRRRAERADRALRRRGDRAATATPTRVADGIVEVLGRGREAYRERLLAAGAELAWPQVVEPLRRIVQLPGPPRALGDPWARRLSRPVQRGRAAAIRLTRAALGALSGGAARPVRARQVLECARVTPDPARNAGRRVARRRPRARRLLPRLRRRRAAHAAHRPA